MYVQNNLTSTDYDMLWLSISDAVGLVLNRNQKKNVTRKVNKTKFNPNENQKLQVLGLVLKKN